MIGIPSRTPAEPAQRAREEAAAAWDHLLAAAAHGAQRVGGSSRRTGAVARERATHAALALRGECPGPSPGRGRWLGTGLAGGVMIGAAAVMALGRRRQGAAPGLPEPARTAATRVRERVGTAVGALRERTGAVTRRTAGPGEETTAEIPTATGEPPPAAGTTTEAGMTTEAGPRPEPAPARRPTPHTAVE
jgi:hypothetical protein